MNVNTSTQKTRAQLVRTDQDLDISSGVITRWLEFICIKRSRCNTDGNETKIERSFIERLKIKKSSNEHIWFISREKFEPCWRPSIRTVISKFELKLIILDLLVKLTAWCTRSWTPTSVMLDLIWPIRLELNNWTVENRTIVTSWLGDHDHLLFTIWTR